MAREQNTGLQSDPFPAGTAYARDNSAFSTFASAAMAARNTAAITGNAAVTNAAGTAEGDIVAALNNIADKLDKIAAKPCCCGGGQGKGQGTIAYVQCAGLDKTSGNSLLMSYHAPLTSQAEANNVNTLIYLGTIDGASNASLGDSFTLDGFAMPETFPVNIERTLDSFPLTLIRSKDGTDWLSFTSPAYAISTGRLLVDPSRFDDEDTNRSDFLHFRHFTIPIKKSGFTAL